MNIIVGLDLFLIDIESFRKAFPTARWSVRRIYQSVPRLNVALLLLYTPSMIRMEASNLDTKSFFPTPLSSPCRSTQGSLFWSFTMGEPIKALLEIDLLRNPRVRNLDNPMKLQTKIHIVGIRILLGINTTLSMKVLLVDVESTRVLFQVEKVATVDADLVVEDQHAEPDLERQAQV